MPSNEPLAPGRLKRAIEAGEDYLLNQQDADGCWTDFDLPEVGPARAWTTAYIAWTLASMPRRRPTATALRAASDALHRERTEGGWSYNLQADADADSTAWAWRFLLRVDDRRGLDPVDELTRFLTPSGSARTFRGLGWQGHWAREHADVTPVVGLALAETGASGALTSRVRDTVLDTWKPPRGWEAYWWSCPSYAAAHSLALLAATGGIPLPLAEAASESIGQPPAGDAHSLEVAMRLLAATALRCTGSTGHLASALLSTQRPDGGWPASSALLLPDPRSLSPASLHADHRRCFTTASAVIALKYLLNTTPPPQTTKESAPSW